MKYIKVFEGKQDKLKKEYFEEINKIFQTYKTYNYIEAQVTKDSNSFSILIWNDGGKAQGFYLLNGDDKSNRLPSLTKPGTPDHVDLTDKEFEYIYKYIEQISNYLDNKEIESKSAVGEEGFNLDISDVDKVHMDIQSKILNHFKEFLNKEYTFDAFYFKDGKSVMGENITLKVTEVELNQLDKELFLKVKCVHDGERKFFDFKKNSENNYISVGEEETENRIVWLKRDLSHLTRVEKREITSKSLDMEIVANKYNTIEFLTEMKRFLELLNDK